MENLVLEQGVDFNLAYESTKKGLKCLFGRKFRSLEEIAEKLKPIAPSVSIPKEIFLRINHLPYVVNEYPIYGLIVDDPEPAEVAKIKVV